MKRSLVSQAIKNGSCLSHGLSDSSDHATPPKPSSEGESSHTNSVSVLIPPLKSPFTYEVPEKYQKIIDIGFSVVVPFGKRKAHGYVIENSSSPSTEEETFAIKPIESLEGNYKHFDPTQIKFFQWVADYYGDTLSSVLEVAVPPAVPQKFESTISIVSGKDLSGMKFGKLQRNIIDLIKDRTHPTPLIEISRKFRGAASAIAKLKELGVVSVESCELIDSHIETEPFAKWAKQSVNLNSFQQESLTQINKSISNGEFKPFLLHGVTGSGKTEVYIEAVQHALSLGKGALIIVPEIALTPQLIDRFRARLGSTIAVLHSALNKRSRWDSWRALLEKRNFVAIGARSGIFAPVASLGLIIVDEEHDGSYKQSEGLRYNARDLALVRARFESCPIVLGSATPSLETLQKAKQGAGMPHAMKAWQQQCLD